MRDEITTVFNCIPAEILMYKTLTFSISFEVFDVHAALR